jgi:hypothetical protein
MREEMKNQTANLIGQDLFGLPVDTAVLFSNHKNVYKRSVEKRQRKLLGKISFILPFLNKGEKILHVTTGCSPVSFAEQFLTGWIVFQLKRSLFVFTNNRIFHIPTKPNLSYRNSIAQILYSDCQKISMKRSVLVVEYKTGKKEKFLYIAGKERKILRMLLENAPVYGRQSDTPERTHLCPRCTNPLIKDVFTCPHCSLEFKDKAQARKISIIYPGGGYFYTRHPFLGIGDAFTELYLTVLVLAVLANVIMGAIEAVPALVLLGFILAFEKTLTVYHSNHFINEFIPKDRKIEVLVSSLQSPPQSVHPPEPTPEEILSSSWRQR